MTSALRDVTLRPAVSAPAAEQAGAPTKAEKDAGRVGAEFEAILVRHMLASSAMGGKGGYADMAVEAMASAISSGGGLGLGHAISQALGPAHKVAEALPSSVDEKSDLKP